MSDDCENIEKCQILKAHLILKNMYEKNWLPLMNMDLKDYLILVTFYPELLYNSAKPIKY